MPFVTHLAFKRKPTSVKNLQSECYTGAYSWLLHVMHIWYQWLESVKTNDIIVYPKQTIVWAICSIYQTVCNALLVTVTKWDKNLSYSWLNYNWWTKSTTDDLHHHRSMQVKKDDHTFSSNNCMDTKVHSTKTKIWASFHIPRQLQHSKTNEQTIRVQCETNW
jgi:hypothetical protein